jgi:hypothetical protein
MRSGRTLPKKTHSFADCPFWVVAFEALLIINSIKFLAFFP